jgi:hypothetical protein
MERAKDAGAAIVKPAQPTFWGGYAGYSWIRIAISGRLSGIRR